jgi:uncharacterized protein
MGGIDMEFKLSKKSQSHFVFEYEKDGEKLAEIEWTQHDNVMDMTHTYVSDTLRGQGVAKKLLDKAADYARENQLKMNGICSYVVAAFEKSDAYDDVKA